METRSAKRKKKLLLINNNNNINTEDEDDEDRISHLPNDILHQILSYLPIKITARTSVLSKRWQNLWHTFPDLDFTTITSLPTTASVSKTTKKRTRGRPHASEYVDQISTLLDKHADIRTLKFSASLTFSRLNSLLRRAVKRNVQELDVEVSTCDYFNFPRSVVTSDALRYLKLKSWDPGFRLPPLHIMKSGFTSLSELSLSRPVLHDQPSLVDLFTYTSFPLLRKLYLEDCCGLKRLRVECPGLEDLCLERCLQLRDLEVRVKKLERLRVSSCFDSYCFGSRVEIDAPTLRCLLWSSNAVTEECVMMNLGCLHEACVGFVLLQEDMSEVKILSVWKFLTGISCCHSLTLESQCIEIISTSNRFAGVSLSHFNKLKSLELSTGFNKHNNPGLASLFRSSPTLHTLIIKIVNSDHNVERRQWNKDLWQSPSSGEERYWESQIVYLNSFLRHLKVVKINGFTECTNDVSLVKFLLKHGKIMQELFLCTSLSKSRDSLLREKIKSQIMGFSRASSNAKIVFQ